MKILCALSHKRTLWEIRNVVFWENFAVRLNINVDTYIDFVRNSQAKSMECFIVICNVNTDI